MVLIFVVIHHSGQTLKAEVTSPCQNSFLGSQIPHILWELKFHDCLHKNPPLVPILSQINSVHALANLDSITWSAFSLHVYSDEHDHHITTCN
jgi:hypothetical protein